MIGLCEECGRPFKMPMDTRTTCKACYKPRGPGNASTQTTEERRAYFREKYHKNKEKCIQYQAKWRAANAEKTREYMRQYRIRKKRKSSADKERTAEDPKPEGGNSGLSSVIATKPMDP